ncbi:hypothetical protein ABBQ32_005880 [Trebouxia sp. C0010 RCD-2024]
MARFESSTELEVFLRALDPEYGQYSLPLWRNGVRRAEQIANADKQDLIAAGVPSALYATDIIVRAGCQGKDGQDSVHEQGPFNKAQTAAETSQQTAAKAFDETPGRNFWKRLDLACKTWVLHGSPSGEGKPSVPGGKCEAFRAFSDELKVIFEAANLSPFRIVKPADYSDHEAYLSALQTMRKEAAHQWYF